MSTRQGRACHEQDCKVNIATDHWLCKPHFDLFREKKITKCPGVRRLQARRLPTVPAVQHHKEIQGARTRRTGEVPRQRREARPAPGNAASGTGTPEAGTPEAGTPEAAAGNAATGYPTAGNAAPEAGAGQARLRGSRPGGTAVRAGPGRGRPQGRGQAVLVQPAEQWGLQLLRKPPAVQRA